MNSLSGIGEFFLGRWELGKSRKSDEARPARETSAYLENSTLQRRLREKRKPELHRRIYHFSLRRDLQRMKSCLAMSRSTQDDEGPIPRILVRYLC